MSDGGIIDSFLVDKAMDLTLYTGKGIIFR